MKTIIQWNDGMRFTAQTGDHKIAMDSQRPIGHQSAPNPKELLAAALGGCTAMDVIALLKKERQPPQLFSVEVEVNSTQGQHPVVFESATLVFTVKGQVDPDKLVEAVKLSQTKYCGVSAMLAPAFPIHYRVELNGVEVGHGQAKFPLN